MARTGNQRARRAICFVDASTTGRAKVGLQPVRSSLPSFSLQLDAHRMALGLACRPHMVQAPPHSSRWCGLPLVCDNPLPSFTAGAIRACTRSTDADPLHVTEEASPRAGRDARFEQPDERVVVNLVFFRITLIRRESRAATGRLGGRQRQLYRVSARESAIHFHSYLASLIAVLSLSYSVSLQTARCFVGPY